MAISAERVVLPDHASFVETAARRIAEMVAGVVQTRGRCLVALAGGATPRPVYSCLATPPLVSQVCWERVEFYFTDERCVPPDDPRSNFRMVAETLLTRVPILAARIHPMRGERRDRDVAAWDYERVLPARLDLLLLGVGSDGHTASLFPRSPALDEPVRRVIPARGPTQPVHRLTITPPVIAAARHVVVLVSGAEKSLAVARALTGPYQPRDLPIQLALHGTWLMDAAAAAAWGPQEAETTLAGIGVPGFAVGG